MMYVTSMYMVYIIPSAGKYLQEVAVSYHHYTSCTSLAPPVLAETYIILLVNQHAQFPICVSGHVSIINAVVGEKVQLVLSPTVHMCVA